MSPRNYCILVAEDNEILRYVTVRSLTKRGYFVLEASNGSQALRLESEFDGTIHLLITNVGMPDMSGHELARTLREKRHDLKVLIVSGSDEKEFPNEARVHDFALLKPVDPHSLLRTVEQLLKQHVDSVLQGATQPL